MRGRRVRSRRKVKANEEILDFNKPAFVFVPKGVHQWRQQGYYLVCKSCELQHAVWIGPDKIMVGQNEKGPILKKRSENR